MTVGFGLIGAGQMAHIHAVAISEQTPGRARIVAVAGGTRAPTLASEFGAEAEPSVEALLDRSDIDAVVIATPHTAHLPNVLAAAAAGKHILLEKPMALDVDECRAMIEACDANGVKLSLAKISRWLEAMQVGHDLVADGTAGELVAHPRPPPLPGLSARRLAARPARGRLVARLGQPRLRHRPLAGRPRADDGRGAFRVAPDGHART